MHSRSRAQGRLGERLLPGVRLRAGYVTATSDSSGRYRVWDLPSYEPVMVAISWAAIARSAGFTSTSSRLRIVHLAP